MAIKINNEQKWIFYWQFSGAIKSLQQNGKQLNSSNSYLATPINTKSPSLAKLKYFI